jgi:hypothetical protein
MEEMVEFGSLDDGFIEEDGEDDDYDDFEEKTPDDLEFEEEELI